jgi:hypothetical protein
MPRAAAVALALLAGAAIAATGCSEKIKKATLPNQLPEVRITSAPIDTNVVCDPSPTRSCYLITVSWVGYDPDGRVDHYLYAHDPKAGEDTLWTRTSENSVRDTFPADERYLPPRPGSDRRIAEAPHIFVLKAVDNDGASGPVVHRSFFSFTEAPSVQITNPTPSGLIIPLFPPSIRLAWGGQDPDGVFNTKPIRYKYILLGPSSEFRVSDAARDPDSLRDFYAPDFDGWTSTSGDSTDVQFTNLIPNQEYLFAVVGFDEAGAYSPVFSLYSNMFRFSVGFAGQNGPKITIFNEFFDYTYRFGGYCPCPIAEINIEVPANIRITFNWTAEPPPGANMQSYRWSLDNPDVSREDERENENDPAEFHKWSTRSINITTVTLGPFAGGTPHRLYIEAEDNNGMRSLGIVVFLPVQSSLERELLIVDDTRLQPDGIRTGQSCTQAPRGPWPTAAELDTFLYAQGSAAHPGHEGWQCYTGRPPVPAGLFSSYIGVGVGSPEIPNEGGVDTTGTRIGRQDLTFRLSRLGLYKRVIWLTDGVGASNSDQGNDPVDPQTALRYMTAPGHFNALAAYIKQGGRVWVAGGGGGFAANIGWNDTGNDRPTTLFSITGRNRELGPGRFMYDVAHWRSEFRVSNEPVDFIRGTGRFGDTQFENGPGSPYATLPPILEKKSTSSDPLNVYAPGRRSSDFYRQVTEAEYIQLENYVIQLVDAGQDSFVERSTLDSLYWFQGVHQPVNVVMTYYEGPDVPQGFFFSGFNLWYFKRDQSIALIDFVLRRWGMAPVGSAFRARPRAASVTAPPPAPEAIGMRTWRQGAPRGASRRASPEGPGVPGPRR